MTKLMKKAVVDYHNRIRSIVSQGQCFHQPGGDVEDLVFDGIITCLTVLYSLKTRITSIA